MNLKEMEQDARNSPGPAKLPDYFFLLRPMILIPVWTFYLLGAHHGARAGTMEIGTAALLEGLASFTALLGAIYIMNQIADRSVDRERNKLFLVSHGIIPARTAWIEAAALIVVSFALALALLPPLFTAILAVSLALGAAYSLEPVRLKKRPAVDVLANALGNGFLNTLAGWIAIGAPSKGWAVLLPYPFAVASVHLATTLADRNADARMGYRTSGVVLGPPRALMLSTALMGGAAIAGYFSNNGPALVASLLSLPFFLVPARSIQKTEANTEVLIPVKTATLIFSITAGFLFHAYLPCIAALILLTRLYYTRRFGLEYPSFRGA
jgi:4-hydroxybenzoate polyprenyltransferase